MNSEATIGEDLRRLFKDILSVDVDLQESAIRALYDAECQLVNPYLVLHGRDEILASYRGQARSNLKISIDIYSVCVSILLCFALFIPHTGAVTAYDATKQIAMVDLHQTLTPKALGGIADVTIHEVLKLQLERSETGTLKIVHHSEIHAAQDFISQVPVLGKWYDGSLRSTLGQVSLAGTQLLDRAGLLDLVPTLALKTKETAQSVVNRASAVTSSAASLGSRAVNMTGVPSVVSRVFNKASGVLSEASSTAKWGASMLMESGRGTEINCYSPTCQPGRLCYSPTCPRGSNTSLLSPEALQDLVRGAYLGVFSNASTSGTS